jgi:large subunit ribosomal protein L31
VTVSALRSKQKDVIDGVECYVVYCDVTSDSHPAYTGERRLVDTAGRVEKFNQKFLRRL